MATLLFTFFASVSSLTCLDDTGMSKDFWIMLKAPQIANVPPLPGKSYIYIDTQNLGYKFSSQPLNDSSAMVRTLSQLNADKSISFVAFNDCPAPACPVYNFGNGHLKGILAYSGNEAIYILHSFPQFPNVSDSNFVTTDIGNSQMMYGQHMFCVKLRTPDLFVLAGQMSIALPNVYASRIVQANQNISLLVNNRSISFSNFFSGFQFFSPNGFEFKYFSKSGASNLDIYEEVISKYYQDGFMCETWGRPWEADFCPPTYQYKNLNIDEVSIGSYWWTSYYDHSKWALGLSNPIVCMSDMNRMTSQWVRGGGAVCIVNQQLYDYFKSITTKYDSC